jgi:hypothetical protein
MARKAKQAVQKSNGGNICRISRQQFRVNAQPLSCKIGDILMSAGPRQFSSGTLGWYGRGESEIEIDGTPVDVKIQVQVWVNKSKELGY